MLKKSGTKVILTNKSRILVFLRDDKPDIPHPNTWDLPGGGVEPGENYIECGEREIKEETGAEVKLRIIKKMPSKVWHGKEMAILEGEVDDSQLEMMEFHDEGQDWRFVTLDELKEMHFVEHLKEFVLNEWEGPIA